MEYDFPLENIIDDIIIEDEREFYLNDDEIDEFIDNALQLMDDIIDENPTIISDTSFFEIFDEEIREQLYQPFENDDLFYTCEENEDDIEFLINYCYMMFFSILYTQRIETDEFVYIKDDNKIQETETQIEFLKNIKQPKQRTPEWYQFRQNHITASNAYKVFENETVRNQIIYEKCTAYVNESDLKIQSESFFQNETVSVVVPTPTQNVNVNSPLHWGQKYEPISVLIYEKKYNTTITDFGCIEHPEYSFLAASPDGINTDKMSPYYGFMLEIKNPVSREIDGNPKKEYWIQCQLQMECCGLDNCHFLETKFFEYGNREEFNQDGDYLHSVDGKDKGVILYLSKNGQPYYFYKPLDMEENEFDVWGEKIIDENEDKMFVRYIYWKLDILSCIWLKRNKRWFSGNIGEIENTWSVIDKERKLGEFKHRAPNRRIISLPDNKDEPDNLQNGLLSLNLNIDLNVVENLGFGMKKKKMEQTTNHSSNSMNMVIKLDF